MDLTGLSTKLSTPRTAASAGEIVAIHWDGLSCIFNDR